ncbi:hypothetical protein HDU87_006505 [Geranomyces variabilis]|uniref:Uncharacterized protein n=1 Tax=Geranomyces variabilis TaxID=109894 RepID=A0AAD5TGL8_9FUNG|nr:hypothetical protein HDU87_006505 [Geranomyces variabilis]
MNKRKGKAATASSKRSRLVNELSDVEEAAAAAAAAGKGRAAAAAAGNGDAAAATAAAADKGGAAAAAAGNGDAAAAAADKGGAAAAAAGNGDTAAAAVAAAGKGGAAAAGNRYRLGTDTKSGTVTDLDPVNASRLGRLCRALKEFPNFWYNYIRPKLSKIRKLLEDPMIFEDVDLPEWTSTLSDSQNTDPARLRSTDELELIPREPYLGVDDTSSANGLLCYLPCSVSNQHQRELVEALHTLMDNYPVKWLPSKFDVRHVSSVRGPKVGTYHLGIWQGTGAEVASISVDSRKTNPIIAAVSKFLSSDAVQKLALLTGHLFESLDNVAAQTYRRAFDNMIPAFKAFWAQCPTNTTFAMLAIVANHRVDCHRDLKDAKDGWCVITCLGSFDNGNAVLPDMGIKVPFSPGDVLFVRSFALHHYVEQWTGSGAERFALVQFTHNLIIHGKSVPEKKK